MKRVAAVFDDDGSGTRGNLAAVFRAILLDREAWRAGAWESYGKLREPVLRFTTVARAFDVHSTEEKWRIGSLASETDGLAQQPYESPSVFNFYRPGYTPPQTELGAQGMQAPEFQIVNESTSIGWVNFIAGFMRKPPDRRYGEGDRRGIRFDYSALLPLVVGTTVPRENARQLVDEIVARICSRGLTDSHVEIAVDTVASISHPDYDLDNPKGRKTRDAIHLDRVAAAIALVAASTDFLYER